MMNDIPTLEELKKLFKVEACESDYNDLLVMYEQRLSCKSCKSLDECPFIVKGLRKYFDGKYFYDKECEYKKISKLKFNQNKKISTLYLPQNVLEASIESYELKDEQRKKIVDFLNKFKEEYKSNNNPKGLYIYGTFAIGKTYTLAMIANELAKENISSALVYFPDLVANLKSSLNNQLEFEKIIEDLKNVDVLLLDDLGSENMTSWVRDEIFGPLINYRLMEKKPVFITSNLNPREDLKNHLAGDKTKANILKAERIIARLNDSIKTIAMDDSKRYER